MSAGRGAREPMEWRLPVWYTAALIVIGAACAALNLYAHPSVPVRVVTIVVGLLSLFGAFAAYRMFFVVDEDGIGVRRLLSEQSVRWHDVADVCVVERGVNTLKLRIVRDDGSTVDVPQSLTVPSKPTMKPVARARLEDLGRSVLAYGEPYRQRW